MATYQKERKEIDQAIRHLMDYMAKRSPWDSLFAELTRQFIKPVASQLDRDVEEVTEALLLASEYGDVARGFLFEEMASVRWNNEEFTMTEAYLKERGWREKPHGKAYLRSLSASQIKLWEVKDAEPGEWIDLQQYRTDKKVRRIQERSASQQVSVGDCIAARVIRVGKHNNITGAPLPITPYQAQHIQQRIDAVTGEIHAIYHQLVKDKEISSADVPDDLTDEITQTQAELTVQLTYEIWAVEALKSIASPFDYPSIRNTDNEEILLTKQRYKIKKDRDTVIQKLDEHFTTLEAGGNTWHWHNDKDLIVATLTVKKDALTTETNSIERAKATTERLQLMMGDLLGQPIAVHESIDSISQNQTPGASPLALDDAAVQDNPALQQALANHLKKHYEGVLDEPIPMLDNLTPRECAAQPEMRDKVVDWLKDLDLHNKKTAQPFDSTPLWEELKLTPYRTNRT